MLRSLLPEDQVDEWCMIIMQGCAEFFSREMQTVAHAFR